MTIFDHTRMSCSVIKVNFMLFLSLLLHSQVPSTVEEAVAKKNVCLRQRFPHPTIKSPIPFHLIFMVLDSTSYRESKLDASSLESFLPCLPKSSVILEGKCFQCIRPNRFGMIKCFQQSNQNHTQSIQKALPKGNTSTCGQHTIYMCPRSEVDSEKLKISKGKEFLHGRLLRIVTIERQPFTKFINDTFSGVVFEFIYALQEKYNFTSNIFFSYDGNWGAETTNGTWNGMVGQVSRMEADIGAAGFSVTLERAKVIDFSMSFHQEPAGILIPAPRPGNQLTILIRPLSPEVWLAVFTTVCVLVPSLFVMHIISLRIRGKLALSKPVNSVRLIADLFQFIVGSLVQESLQSPVNKTSRFLVVIWWFLTLVLANVYVGYMVSFLSAPKLYDIVDGLEGLTRQTALRWTYRKNAALEDLFQSSSGEVYKAIARATHEDDLVTSDFAGVEKTLTGRYAFIKEKSFLDVALNKDFEQTRKCRMTTAKETFFTVGTAVIVQKGCEFLELLDREILNAVNTGLMEKWKRIHWPKNLFCVDAASYIVKTQPKTRKLTMDDCQGAYFLLICGLALSIGSFLYEIGQLLVRAVHKSSDSSLDESSNPQRAQRVFDEMDTFKIIVIPVKEEFYRKLSVFDAKTRVMRKV